MRTLRFILGDQLTRSIGTLADLDPAQDVVLMAEVHDETTYVRHHKQKIAFVLSAMRHFADELRAEGITVDYVRLDDPDNAGSFGAELKRAVARHRPDRVVVTEPGEWRVLAMMRDWREELDVPLEIQDDERFLCSRAAFARWAGERKQLRMEFFYREMRRKTGFLMDGPEPVGGRWNFDPENRKRLPARIVPPSRSVVAPDATTREVLELVGRRFDNHFGDLEPFAWPVTRSEALRALDHFIREGLPLFGDYQDAMRTGEPFLFHAALAPALNVGLLLPDEVCRAAERAYREGAAPLNAVEGFIRQVLGWREYVRGIYWAFMPDYAASNALDAQRPLPWFYWTGETEMNCLRQCISDTKRHAYAHHIQRLMVTGNFALLAGIRPAEIEEWYLVVYADAFEWVELPNVHGMVAWADGGMLGSKPYAASGAYIDRMSDYCGSCAYDVAAKSGPKACPFNYLYWNFLIENTERLSANPRLAMPYRTLAKMPPARVSEIRADAARFLASLDPVGEPAEA
ncbi:MAG TPA: cryptochrome/photolyase family protein [Beijerinckiaceae bacterium]|jgi:deoxyribodipyrimidine photolyase-related protein